MSTLRAQRATRSYEFIFNVKKIPNLPNHLTLWRRVCDFCVLFNRRVPRKLVHSFQSPCLCWEAFACSRYLELYTVTKRPAGEFCKKLQLLIHKRTQKLQLKAAQYMHRSDCSSCFSVNNCTSQGEPSGANGDQDPGSLHKEAIKGSQKETVRRFMDYTDRW